MTYSPDLQQLLEREAPPGGGTTGRHIDYRVDGVDCAGYLATPSGSGVVPGVLVLHDGSGVGDHERVRCDALARLSFHGGLQTGPPGEAAGIRARLLVLTGAADPVVPDEDVRAFQDELRGAPDLDWQLVTYSGAMHAFAVPGTDTPDLGARYDPVAERRSWAAAKAFLAEVLAPWDRPGFAPGPAGRQRSVTAPPP